MKFIIEGFGKKKDPATVPLIDHIVMGIDDAGVHDIDIIRFFDKTIVGCDECDICQKNGGVCVKNDDALKIVKAGLESDFPVFIVPIIEGELEKKFVNLVERFVASSTVAINKNAALYVLYDSYTQEQEANDVIDKYIKIGELVNLNYTIIRKVHIDKLGNLIDKNALMNAYKDFCDFEG